MKFSMQMPTFLEKQSIRTQRQCTCSRETLKTGGRVKDLGPRSTILYLLLPREICI